ncbi:hypothetical protein AO269_08375 [Pseudomonas putida]|nr:hypothetical protein AO269_08375 [Pseudomonas putida]
MHTVPACAKCNQGGASADEIMKIMIGLSTGELRPDSPMVLDSMRRTLKKNKRLRREVIQSSKPTFHPLHGQIFRPAVAVHFDGKPYIEVITRIVKALYWVEKGSALGLAAKVDVEIFDQIDDPGRVALVQTLMNSLEPRHLNESTFVYKVTFDESGCSIWGLMFFGGHLAIATADAPAHLIVS